MSNYLPPSENVPIFDSSLFNQGDEALTYESAITKFLTFPTAQGTETLLDVNVQGTSNFDGTVNFNSILSPPHCDILPSNENDLCNKLYVDSQAALTAYQLYLNYSDTFTTPAPTSIAYKSLSQLQVPSPSTFPFTISAIGTQLIGGFFNTLIAINVPLTIPAGVWTLLCFSNVNLIADQAHIGLQYTISSFDASGVETLVYTSPISALLSVVSPLIGTSSVSGTFPATTLAVGTTGLGLKLFIVSNTNSTRTGNIFFQNADSYSSVLTSFAVTQAPNLLSLNNTWTGTNSFNNASSSALSSIANATFQTINIGLGNGNVASNLNVGSVKAFNNSTTGTGNISIGGSGSINLTSGSGNTLIGSGNNSNLLTSGSNNTVIGNGNMGANQTGTGNTIIGNASATIMNNGTGNVIIGSGCFANGTNNIGNICIGNNSNCSAGLTRATAIGTNSLCTTGSTVQLGSGVDNVNCPNTLSVVGTITAPNITGTAGVSTLGTVGISNSSSNKPVLFIDTATSTAGNYGLKIATTYTNNLLLNEATGLVTTNQLAITGGIISTGIVNTDGLLLQNTSIGAIGSSGGITLKTVSTNLSKIIISPQGVPALTVNANGIIDCASALNTGGTINSLNIGTRGQNLNVLISGTTTFTAGIGAGNTIIGGTCGSNVTGISNTLMGNNVMNAITTGIYNTCIGQGTGRDAITTASENAYFGHFSGASTSTGSKNTFIGANVAASTNSNTTGTNNTTLGYDAKCNSGALTFATAIGSGAVVISNNTVVLGRSTDNIEIPGNLSLASSSTITAGVNIDMVGATTTLGSGTVGGNMIIAANTTGGTVGIRTNNVQRMTVTETAITHSLNTTLPVGAASPTALTQLGGTNSASFNLSLLGSGIIRNIATSPTLPIGIYIMTGSVNYVCVTAAVPTILSSYFSSTGVYPVITTQAAASLNAIGSSTITYAVNASIWLPGSCIITVTTPIQFTYSAYWTGTGTFNVGGSASFTRIA